MQGGKITTKDKNPAEGKCDKNTTQKVEFVAPDGGWGWIVVFAFALCNVIIVPILQSFGLLFRERFETLEISGTDASVIINVNAAFGMILGLLTGYLLRNFGYRKISIAGAIINSIGVILTSQANSFGFFLFSYGIISSVGFNLLASGLNLAINTYFRERRGKAVGFGTTAMGLGPVFMPLVISKLMDVYGIMGTSLILGGLSLHSIAGALLLQPVKWHMKPKETTLAAMENGNEDDEAEERKSLHIDEPSKRRRTLTTGSSIDHDIDTQSVYGFETPLPEHRVTGRRRYSMSSFKRSTTHVNDPNTRQAASEMNWWASAASLDTANFGSSVKIDDKPYEPLREADEDDDKRNKEKKISESDMPNVNSNGIGLMNKNANTQNGKNSAKEKEDDESERKEDEISFWKRIRRGIVAFFDLGLLKDPIYVNLMVGMSLAICAELNFSLLTPFILNDKGFDTDRTAILMSIIAGLDIVFRFFAPFFSDYYKIKARVMYIIALIMLISSRTALIFSQSFEAVIAVSVALGVAKGVRTVYMTIVIPSYVPIERLPAASGIQMVVNGILLMAFGPLTGLIRDVSESYDLCIGFINLLTFVTLSMWTLEIVITHYKQRNQQNTEDSD
ncbi:uncharacterized protein LOC110827025 [Zootermopsis nevadensis]|uniref:uncharacterized protein LOC110827025 n=1 Tax=Zootermopsis nevadensis TaxID=136037 RepID=UPI000B8ECAFE|nr:uncharacterized protein LOC110827025 [Zootermopsis nevadensis]